MKEITKHAYTLLGLLTKGQLCRLMGISPYTITQRFTTENWKAGELASIKELYKKYFGDESK